MLREGIAQRKRIPRGRQHLKTVPALSTRLAAVARFSQRQSVLALGLSKSAVQKCRAEHPVQEPSSNYGTDRQAKRSLHLWADERPNRLKPRQFA
jgi:hypothetical protein